jgi:hypothetical protein
LLDEGAYEACLDKLEVLKQLAPQYDVGVVQEQARLALGERLYQQATKVFQAGEYQRCLDTLAEIRERDPGFQDKESLAEQARRLLERQQYLRGLYDISVEQSQAENWAAALQTLQELYQEAPYYADVEVRLTMIRYIARLSDMYERAEEAFRAQQYVVCIEQLDELAQLNQEYKCDHSARLRERATVGLYEQAEALLEEGQFERALAALDSLEMHTDHQDTRHIRLKAREGVAARELQNKLQRLYDQAAKNFELRQYATCLGLLEQIGRVDADFSDTRLLEKRAREGQCSLLYAQALGALVKKEYREAEVLWNQIRSLDPQYPDPQNLGEHVQKGTKRWQWLGRQLDGADASSILSRLKRWASRLSGPRER